jgi:phosphate transport system protein
MELGGHIITGFTEALNQLQEKTILMGTNALANIDNAINGLLTRNITLCDQSIADDDEEDRLEMEVDKLGMYIIVRYRPLARDLRMVLSSMKISSNLERISDHAVYIAKRSRKMLKGQELEAANLIQPVYKLTRDFLSICIQAYADGDPKLALEILGEDKKVSKAYKKATKQFTKNLEVEKGCEREYLDLLFIARYLDRVSSYAANIAEDIIFTHTNVDVRHGSDLPSNL